MRRADFSSVPTASGLGATVRSVCLLLAIGLIILLVVASRLSPNSSGMGTHQQLGLPPCSIRILYGIRCPACGMTTSWAYLTHGQFLDAARANLAGVGLGFLAVTGIPVLARMSLTGRPASNRTSWIFAIGLISMIAVATIEWVLRIMQ